MTQKIILDVDPGVDDALAIILALRSPELKVQAITTVSGNVNVEKTYVNTLKSLEVVEEKEIPVAKGLSHPLLRELVTAEYFHGSDGLGDSKIPAPRIPVSGPHAVDLIIDESLNSRRGGINLIATGPLTNIAAALIREPEVATKVKEVVIMGGAYGVTPFGHGNHTPVAEFNIYVDPEAAKIVFSSGISLIAVGLDVTADPFTYLTGELCEVISKVRNPRASFATRITRNIMSKYGRMALHDPMAVCVAADRGLVETMSYHVDVETQSELTRGQTVTDRRDCCLESKSKHKATICTRIDSSRFIGMFMQRLLY